jgi:hypothetical protein
MQKKKLQIKTNNIKNAWLADSYMNIHHNSSKDAQLGINTLLLPLTRLQFSGSATRHSKLIW